MAVEIAKETVMSEEVKTLEKKVRKKFRKVGISSAELRAEVAKASQEVAETTRSIRELRAEVAEMSRGIFKSRQEHEKAGISSAELRAEVAKTNRGFRKLRHEHEKTVRVVRKVSKMVGSISNNNGKTAEEFFANSLKAKPVFCNEPYDTVIRNLHPARGGKGAEFDIVMTNGKKVVLIEVKYCAHPEDLRKLVEQKVSEFRQWCPSFANHKVYLGIASLSFNDEVLKEAEILGVAVLRQVGDTLEITGGELKAF